MSASDPASIVTLQIAIPGPFRQVFDYWPPTGVDAGSLKAGMRVEVPFGRGDKTLVGFLVGLGVAELLDQAKLKSAIAVLDPAPLLSALDCDLLHWASRYYHHPLGEVFAAAFPALLKQVGHERRLCLTPAGRAMVGGVKAKRQAELLALLDEVEESCSVAELNKLDWAWQGPVKKMLELGWVAFQRAEISTKAVEAGPERWLALTKTGWLAEPSTRSPRQGQLWQILKQQAQGFPAQRLNDLDWDWRSPAKALVEKGWACFREEQRQADITAFGLIADPPQPNPAQAQAIAQVAAALGTYQVFLLEGVTGSGKTEVYLRLLEQVLAQGLQAMVLVPEINLTPQLEARFRARFSVALVVSHSSLNDRERAGAWLAMQRGEAALLLGTRSAVFTPLARPGLVILDEEHDGSFKQQEGFRFSARDVANVRAKQWQVPILMGSATPSLESLANVQRGRYVRLELPERTGSAVPPHFHKVDIRQQKIQEGLSPAMINQIHGTLRNGEQTLLFLNRRGYAPTLICHACGWVAECRRCDARLVIHAAENVLRCHHCSHEEPKPKACPHCQTADLRPLGLGTERVELALSRLFPKAKVLRIDRDSTRHKGSLEKMLGQIHRGEVDILLGTQMLAKGHHFPHVTLVGILDVDGGLFSLDFRASERTAQLITQVAGRAGREERPGLVILQTRQPEHPLLNTLIQCGYRAFAEAALAEREEADLPPYTYQALWRAESHEEAAPTQFLDQLMQWVDGHFGDVLALGPVPAPMPRQAGKFRQQLLLQSHERKALHACLADLIRHLPQIPDAGKVRWSVDVDPLDLY